MLAFEELRFLARSIELNYDSIILNMFEPLHPRVPDDLRLCLLIPASGGPSLSEYSRIGVHLVFMAVYEVGGRPTARGGFRRT